MASYFIDLDGVFFRYGTMRPNRGAVESVNQLTEQGHQVFFVTARRYKNNPRVDLNLEKTEDCLRRLGVNYAGIIGDVSSPRIIINDEGAVAINHSRNADLTDDCVLVHKHKVEEKLYCAFASLAWTSYSYHGNFDADDYIQPMLIAKSLISNQGFDHRDIVRRYRRKPDIIINGRSLRPGGVSREYRGQISKLIQDSNPLYVASDGVSDGAAMKLAPIVGYYLDDLEEMVRMVDKITVITHAAVEARLSAQLIAMRFRRIFLEDDADDIDALVRDLERSARLLEIEERGQFFVQIVKKAAGITKREDDPEKLLAILAEQIGIDFLAWTTPVTACFWSFRADNDFPKWFSLQNERRIHLKDVVIDHTTMSPEVLDSYVEHLRATGMLEAFRKTHGYHWCKSIDGDTFFAITFSIVAAEKGIGHIVDDLQQVNAVFSDDWRDISRKLVYRIGVEAPTIRDHLDRVRKAPRALLADANEEFRWGIRRAGRVLKKKLPGVYSVLKGLKDELENRSR